MDRLKTPEEMHRHREGLLGDDLADKQDIVARVEAAVMRHHPGGRVENLYGIEGHPLKQRLRDAVAFYLKHHEKARLSKEHIAAYLHCSEKEVLECIERAELELVERSTSATSGDLMVIGQNLGVVLGQLMRTLG